MSNSPVSASTVFTEITDFDIVAGSGVDTSLLVTGKSGLHIYIDPFSVNEKDSFYAWDKV
jgi:hypothetical protein